MIAEHTTALSILMNDDLYLTKADRENENPSNILIEPITVPAEKGIETIHFIGKNFKNFLILSNEPLLENQQKALESTLSRKQMSLDDVALIDYSAVKNYTTQQLIAFFMPVKIVLLGLDPKILHLPETELNQIKTYPEYQVLYTYNFEEMLGDKQKTKAFWDQMKHL